MFVPPVFLFFKKPFNDYGREQKEREETAKALQESRIRDYEDFIKSQNEYFEALEAFENLMKEKGIYEQYIDMRVKSQKFSFQGNKLSLQP